MKILSFGNIPTRKASCSKCQSEMEYTNFDLEYFVEDCMYDDMVYHIKCPVCGSAIRTDYEGNPIVKLASAI